METKKEKKFSKRYETQLKSAYENKNYGEVYKLLDAFPYLINYLTKSQAIDITKYLLVKNISDIKEMKSSLEKTLDKIENKLK